LSFRFRYDFVDAVVVPIVASFVVIILAGFAYGVWRFVLEAGVPCNPL
jgi:hypothetical protein